MGAPFCQPLTRPGGLQNGRGSDSGRTLACNRPDRPLVLVPEGLQNWLRPFEPSPRAPPHSKVVSRVTRRVTPLSRGHDRSRGGPCVGWGIQHRPGPTHQSKVKGRDRVTLGRLVSRRRDGRFPPFFVFSLNSTCCSDGHHRRRRGHTAQLPRPVGQGHPQAGGPGSPLGRRDRVTTGQGRPGTALGQAGRRDRVTPRPARWRSGLRRAGRRDRVTPRPAGGRQGRARLFGQRGDPMTKATTHRLVHRRLVCGGTRVQGDVVNKEVTAITGRAVGLGGGRRAASRWGFGRSGEV